MEMNPAAPTTPGARARSGAAVLHTVSTEAAWRLQKLRVR
jgi:hypothetical protein